MDLTSAIILRPWQRGVVDCCLSNVATGHIERDAYDWICQYIDLNHFKWSFVENIPMSYANKYRSAQMLPMRDV